MRQADGYKVLKALLPPPERRGLVLIDPPFEASDEFERLLRACARAAPLCDRLLRALVSDQGREADAFLHELAALRPLILELRWYGSVRASSRACGLAVINPPWRFEEAMREALPWIAAQLGPGVTATVDPRKDGRVGASAVAKRRAAAAPGD